MDFFHLPGERFVEIHRPTALIVDDAIEAAAHVHKGYLRRDDRLVRRRVLAGDVFLLPCRVQEHAHQRASGAEQGVHLGRRKSIRHRDFMRFCHFLFPHSSSQRTHVFHILFSRLHPAHASSHSQSPA